MGISEQFTVVLHTDSQDHLQQCLDHFGLEWTADGKLIRWSSSNRRHPRNWRPLRKIFDTGVIIFLEFFT